MINAVLSYKLNALRDFLYLSRYEKYHTKRKDKKRDQQILLDYVCPRQTISKASENDIYFKFHVRKMKFTAFKCDSNF